MEYSGILHFTPTIVVPTSTVLLATCFLAPRVPPLSIAFIAIELVSDTDTPRNTTRTIVSKLTSRELVAATGNHPNVRVMIRVRMEYNYITSIEVYIYITLLG